MASEVSLMPQSRAEEAATVPGTFKHYRTELGATECTCRFDVKRRHSRACDVLQKPQQQDPQSRNHHHRNPQPCGTRSPVVVEHLLQGLSNYQ